VDVILTSLSNIFEPTNFLFIVIGVVSGIIFGALPGIAAVVGVTLMLPLTYGLPPETGLLMLAGVYAGGIFGGSITAILINTPGTPAAAATALDGYALSQKGRGGEAIGMALIASAFGGVFSTFVLLFIAPQVAKLAYEFGAPEFFALAFFGLSMIINVSGESILKGFIMGLLGMIVATVGMDPVGGIPRFTFDNVNFSGGIELIPALIGLFAIAEFMRRSELAHRDDAFTESTHSKLPIKEGARNIKTLIKSSVIGTGVGATPGTGTDVGAFIAYSEAKRSSKNKKEFGKGSMEGVAAAESGNNSVTGATLIPLLTLGIPGDSVTAVMLGALLMQGMTPGPQLFVDYADVMYTLMLGLFFVNILMFLIGSVSIKLFVKITSIPMKLLVPILLSLSFVGAFAVNNNAFDMKVMLVFGVVGFILPRFDFPVVPMLLGMILGPIAERALRQSMILSDGSPVIFLTHPIALIFILLAIASFIAPAIKKKKEKT